MTPCPPSGYACCRRRSSTSAPITAAEARVEEQLADAQRFARDAAFPSIEQRLEYVYA